MAKKAKVSLIDKSGRQVRGAELRLHVEALKRRYPAREERPGALTEEDERRLLGEFLKSGHLKYRDEMERARRHERERTELWLGKVVKNIQPPPWKPASNLPAEFREHVRKMDKMAEDPERRLRVAFLREVFHTEMLRAGVYEEHPLDRRPDLSEKQWEVRRKATAGRLDRVRRAFAEGRLPLDVVELILLTETLIGDSSVFPEVLKGYGKSLGPVARAAALENAALYEAIKPLGEAFTKVSRKVRKEFGELTKENIAEYSKAWVQTAHGDPSKDEIAPGIMKFAGDAGRIHKAARRIRKKKPEVEL